LGWKNVAKKDFQRGEVWALVLWFVYSLIQVILPAPSPHQLKRSLGGLLFVTFGLRWSLDRSSPKPFLDPFPLPVGGKRTEGSAQAGPLPSPQRGLSFYRLSTLRPGVPNGFFSVNHSEPPMLSGPHFTLPDYAPNRLRLTSFISPLS